MNTLVRIGPSLAVAVVVLVGTGCAAAYWGHLGHARGVLTAALRAVGQLTLIALVLAEIVSSPAASLAFVASMSAIASLTAARRLCGKGAAGAAGTCAVPVAAGPLLVVSGLLALGVLPAAGVAVVPVAGILIGGAMTATTLAGRRGLDELRVRRGEVEAALAIAWTGARPRCWCRGR